MTQFCPYCQTPLTGELALPALSKRRRWIYEAVAMAGRNGIPAQRLVLHMYETGQKPSPGAYVMLRVHIHEMNKLLVSVKQRITAKPYGAYRLISTGDYNGETAKGSSA